MVERLEGPRYVCIRVWEETCFFFSFPFYFGSCNIDLTFFKMSYGLDNIRSLMKLMELAKPTIIHDQNTKYLLTWMKMNR